MGWAGCLDLRATLDSQRGLAQEVICLNRGPSQTSIWPLRRRGRLGWYFGAGRQPVELLEAS